MSLASKKVLTQSNTMEIYVNEQYTFDQLGIKEAIQKFQDNKDEGVIVNCEYSSDIWFLKSEKVKSNRVKIEFDIDLYKELKEALKTFVAFEITRITSGNVRQNVQYIKKAILASNGFKEELITNLEDEIATSYKPYEMSRAVKSFMYFIDHPLKQDYSYSLDIFRPKEPQTRTLVNFKDLLLFGQKVDEFQASWNEREKLLYFPIIIWWRLTCIIPLRTGEFVGIKRNCLIDKGGNFFIQLPRTKQKAKNKRDLDIEDVVPLNESVYKLIQEYIDFTEVFGEAEQLLSTKAYIAGLGMKKNFADEWYPVRLSKLINHFYDNVIIKKMGLSPEIERIKPMDTRHYAFMNLKLSGVNELTIARLGGHRTIHAQEHYFKHLDEFADSYVYSLTRLRRFKMLDSKLIEYKDENDLIIQKSRIRNPKKEDLKMHPFGVCTFPDIRVMGCPKEGECRHCTEWFRLTKAELENPLCYEWYQDHSNYLAKRIRESIALMRAASKGLEYDFSNLQWFSIADEELKTLSRDISAIMIQKSIVDSVLEEMLNE
ncbi:site-specific integrase [Brevibacterium sp. PAMC23299]|nr:site-specific integrase [Brevibacterium sp. PAMC23299]